MSSSPTVFVVVRALNSTLGSPLPTDDIIPPDSPDRDWSSIIGITTAIGGNVLIALALNVQRFAHIKLHEQRASIRARIQRAQRRAKLQVILEQNESHELPVTDQIACRISVDDASDFDHLDLSGTTSYGTLSPVTATTSPRPHESVESSRSDVLEDGTPILSEKTSSLSYLRSPYWWLGQVLITLGEMGNFLAYGFAPASIVSPLGVVALVSNCVIAPILFHEKFRVRDFWGVVIAVAGVVVVVLSSAGDESKLAPHDVWDAITALAFEVYLCITVAMIATLMWASKRYGKRTILIDLGLVGLFGGYTALATKGVSSMLSSTLLGAFQTPVIYALLFVLIATAIMQIRYLNRALQRFDSTQVIPIQFVMFTLCVIVGSAILYRDFERTTVTQSLAFTSGCLLTFFGVFLITSGRPRIPDEEAQLSDTDGIDETIGLASQQAYSDVTPPDSPRNSISSRRSSRTNFPTLQSDRRISLSHETGILSTRMPVRNSNDLSRPPILSIWEEPDDIDNPPPRPDPTPLQHGLVSDHRPTSIISEPAFFEPSTPPPHSHIPFHSNNHIGETHHTSTPSRPSSHRFAGPVISASPFSSAVSAVMTDTLRRDPLTSRTSLGRIGYSIRQSMFMDDYDDDDNEVLNSMLSREPLLGPLVEISEVSEHPPRPATSRERSFNKTGTRNRHRSLSDTFGSIFGPWNGSSDVPGNSGD